MRDAILHHNMLNLDSNRKFFAADFDFDTLRSMTAEQRDLMNFVGFPERHGYDALNEFFPFNPRYGKEDPRIQSYRSV